MIHNERNSGSYNNTHAASVRRTATLPDGMEMWSAIAIYSQAELQGAQMAIRAPATRGSNI